MSQNANHNLVVESMLERILKGQRLEQVERQNQQKQLEYLRRQQVTIQDQLQQVQDIVPQLQQMHSVPLQLNVLYNQIYHLQHSVLRAIQTANEDPGITVNSMTAETSPSNEDSATPFDNYNYDTVNDDDGDAMYNDIDYDNIPKDEMNDDGDAMDNDIDYDNIPNDEMNDDDDDSGNDDDVIPLTTYQLGKDITKIPKSEVTKVINERLIRDTVINHAIATDDTYIHTDDKAQQANYIYQQLYTSAKSICSKSPSVPTNVLYNALPESIATQLIRQFEQKVKQKHKIRLDKAEDHWLTHYFIGCYFRNLRTNFNRRKRNAVKEPKKRLPRNSAVSTSAAANRESMRRTQTRSRDGQ
ncbi:unnamed protein product [Absidia cylindrospora]